MVKGLLTLLMLAGIAAASWYLPAKGRHHYSETGVFYTTDYLTLHTANGVIGFPPGSRLRACFTVHVPDKEVVTDGKYMLAVDSSVLTHDVEYGSDLAESDRADQDRTLASIAQRKAQSAAGQHAAELVAARDIEGANAAMIAASVVGNNDTALNRPTTVAGSYASYGGGGYAGGGASSGTVVNNVRVTQNNFGVGASASRGGGGMVASSSSLPGNVVLPKKPVSGLSAMPMNP